tara:strand:+ start:244 stop:873 length:630 start_codon:yes stop_codon:yes gene_type:complete
MCKEIEWRFEKRIIPYESSHKPMKKRVENIINGSASELIWLLEHQEIYTAGTSAKFKDLLNPNKFSIYKVERGGQYTYHGPGQRVVYVMLDIRKRSQNLREFVWLIEEWIIKTLQTFDIKGERNEGNIGIWVKDKEEELKKIAAIGIRIRKWITYHGFSINFNTNISGYDGIVPCGISNKRITSMHLLGPKIERLDLDKAIKENFKQVF